jgi:ABC-type lipoprotein export system ATPase subunit
MGGLDRPGSGSVLVATHDPVLTGLADRVLYLEDGRLRSVQRLTVP